MLGSEIKKARTAKELSQRKVATMVGVTQQAFQQIEKGKKMPMIETLCKIANALGKTVDELMWEEIEKWRK